MAKSTIIPMKKLRRHIIIDRLLRNPNGMTTEEIWMNFIDDIEVTLDTIKYELKNWEKTYHCMDTNVPIRKRQRVWKYKDPNFSIFRQEITQAEEIYKAIDNLGKFKGNPMFLMLKFYLLQLTQSVDHPGNPIITFQHRQEYEGKQIDTMEIIAQAMLNKGVLRIKYQDFENVEETCNVHPYHLRQYNDRWFLFGWSEKLQEIKNFPIDRIKEAKQIAKEYRPCDVDFEHYFDDFIGVSDVPTEVQTVRFKVKKGGGYGQSGSYNYIVSKPLHSSQDEIEMPEGSEDEDYAIFTIDVKINYELKMLLFSYHENIEVLEPAELRDWMRDKINNMKQMYDKG